MGHSSTTAVTNYNISTTTVNYKGSSPVRSFAGSRTSESQG